MSLYNMLFGNNPLSSVIVATLGLKVDQVPRFRDCYVDGEKIVIHTRMGGGNRDCWDTYGDNSYKQEDGSCGCPACSADKILRGHKNYLSDQDDDFDCTYADFYFSFPDDYAEMLKSLNNPEQLKPSEKWQELFKILGEKKEPAQ